ncbi:ABC transporter permease subunit [Nocardia puris]|uniref:ABC-2 type transport system permease protein n=1 Tax=Nocardia puris TaxID=208602 RepID=A0A366E1M1_9NOCA|nr:ABC transporter permease subunit [Nocardia puris]RBO96025.1 ABC-2 type transport system permease protein [Nocardia puris]
MLRTVYLKSLRDQRRGLIGWSLGIVLLVLAECALWQSFSEMTGIEEFLASYPEPLRELFDLDAFTTGTGFLNAELFSMLVPVLFLVFAIARGARGVAGDEERGTLEVVLVNGVSPVRLALEHAGALVTAVAALGVVLFGAVLGFGAVFGLGIAVSGAASGALAMVLLGVEFGLLALAVGSATGRRVVALAVASVFAVAAYVLYVASKLVESMGGWGPWSPFHQALEGGPLGAGLPWAYLWLPVAGTAALLIALPVFDRRDITGV